MKEERNPLYNAKPGDLWKSGSLFLLVDHADPFQLGITIWGGSKTIRTGFRYRVGFERYIEHNKYEFVSKDDAWPYDEEGCSEGDAVEYIKSKCKS